MISPETASATKLSLAQEWLHAFRFWLRGRNGVIALVVLAVVVGAALSWSWLVAVGVAPLLLAFAPCAVMCGLGLCMHKMAGGSCSTSSSAADHPSAAMPNVARQIPAASEPARQAPVSVAADTGALPDRPIADAVEPAPNRQTEVLKERE